MHIMSSKQTASGYFAVLHQIRSIHHTASATVTCSCSILVLSHLNTGTTLLAGVPQQLTDKRTSIDQNASEKSECLAFAAGCRDQITLLLFHLHWLYFRWRDHILVGAHLLSSWFSISAATRALASPGIPEWRWQRSSKADSTSRDQNDCVITLPCL